MPPGLWGFASGKNRQIGEEMFKLITDPNMIPWHAQHGHNSTADQVFIETNLLSIVQKNNTSHDSFFCNKFGGQPFPSKRTPEYCHVGGYGCCEISRKNNYYSRPFRSLNLQCPHMCRPKNHSDWFYC